MDMPTKKLIVPLIAVLILLAAISVIYLSSPRSIVRPITTHTPDLKVYRNDKRGFEIRYPADWIATSSPWAGYDVPDDSVSFELWDPEALQAAEIIGEGMPSLSVDVIPNRDHLGFEQWYDSYDPGHPLGSPKVFPIGASIEGFLTRPLTDAGIADCCEVIFVPTPDKAAFIKFTADSFSPSSEAWSAVRSLALYSGNDESSRSYWHAYTNPQAGFQISLPPGWILFPNAASIDNSWYFLSTSTPLIHGIGIPPVGGMWIGIAKGICNEPSADFLKASKPNISERSICLGDFQISLGLWSNDPRLAANEHLLEKIAATFRTIDPGNAANPGSVSSLDIIETGYAADLNKDMQRIFVSPSKDRIILASDIEAKANAITPFYGNAEKGLNPGAMLPFNPENQGQLIFTAGDTSCPEGNSNCVSIDGVYSYDLTTGIVKLFYTTPPVQNYADGAQLVIIATQGSKIIFYRYLVGTGGPCDTTWAGRAESYAYLDLDDLNAGLRKYAVPAYKAAEATAQVEECQQGL